MIFLMTLLIFIKITLTASGGSAGSTIFYKYNSYRKCWTEEDIAKLRARKVFEDLFLPLKTDPHEINGKYIKEELRYFRRALRSVEQFNDPHVVNLLKQALSDSIGAHLRSEILPSVRFAFYAGYIPYRSARQIHELFDEQKTFLNTQGLGWKTPDKLPKWSNLSVAKLSIGSDTLFDSCSTLVTKRDAGSCIHLPTPKFDDDLEPTAIALPFKTGGLVSLTSPSANNILIKYYTAASRCILRNSPVRCRHTDFVSFNNEMWHWMKRDVAPHLVDEKLYPAYAGVLRIAAAVQNYGKGLSRRNLYDYQDQYLTNWHPWHALTSSGLYVDTDWTPQLIIFLVIIIAIAVYLVQICYNHIFGEASTCRCKQQRNSRSDINLAYTTVESNIPAMLPQQQKTVFYSSDKKPTNHMAKAKSISLGSIKTSKLSGANGNTESPMHGIESDKELSESLSSEGESEVEDDVDKNDQGKGNSPPMLETSISQIKIEKTPRNDSRSRTPMYSTSSTTKKSYRAPHKVSEPVWSGSSSSSSSVTSSSKSQKSLSSRGIPWARRVVSKNSSRKDIGSISRTELDFSSFTTPPSKR